MKILITGGTGLVGSSLMSALHNQPSISELIVLTRNIKKARSKSPRQIKYIDDLDELNTFDEIDAVINLAGEPIMAKRWSLQQKERICTSRWSITQRLTQKITQAKNPPRVLISASAVGFYGAHGTQELDESAMPNVNTFTYQVCSAWEKSAQQAQSSCTRVCLARFGIVLSRRGGALAKMLPAYQLGLGGRIGSGAQYFPWIHIDDAVSALLLLLQRDDLQGAFNICAPAPVTNLVFSQALAKQLKRPHLFPLPAFLIKLALGEASQLLLDSLRVYPNALLKNGFSFRYPDIELALQDLLSKK
ncbi:MAG: TIGR01777 family oxidoreductase [Enterovibrio sp.]